MIWKNKLSPDILVLTKALAEYWRGRDWLKKLWQLGRLLWMLRTPPLLYVYKATCCTALFIAQTPQQKTVSIFPMGEAASGYFTARKSHRSFSFHHAASGFVCDLLPLPGLFFKGGDLLHFLGQNCTQELHWCNEALCKNTGLLSVTCYQHCTW